MNRYLRRLCYEQILGFFFPVSVVTATLLVFLGLL